jgi:hypothetical protein
MFFAVALTALAIPAAGLADQPQSIRFETHGVFTGPSSASGTFVASGLVSDSGTYAETFHFAGSTLHVVKTLSGQAGTITLIGQGVVRWTSPTTATFAAGHWWVSSGTGAYEGLRAGGSPGAVGTGDLLAGTADVVHVGEGQLG